MSTDQKAKQNTVCRTLVVIGVGLIGGSLAKAAKQRQVCERVVGIFRQEATCHQAKAEGVVDEAYTSFDTLASELNAEDIVCIAVPTLSVKGVLAMLKDTLNPEVTITDAASVKGSVVQDMIDVYGAPVSQFVPGHPIAGSERSGVGAANAELYVDHRVILTPVEQTGSAHLKRVEQLWRAVGAEVVQLSVQDHDDILGATSHLPHAIAFSLVDTLAHDSQNQNIFRYAAGGFRDFTRIASSDAVMWRDIMLANRSSVLKAIDLFSANLANLRSAVEHEDAEQLLDIFKRSKTARDAVVQAISLAPRDI